MPQMECVSRCVLTGGGAVPVDNIPTEVGGYGPGIQGERLETFGSQPLSEFEGEQDVRCLRLAVRTELVVCFAILTKLP